MIIKLIVRKIHIIVNIVLWSVFLGSYIFLGSGQFFDGHLIPKWLAFAVTATAIVLYNLIRQFVSQNSELRVFCDMREMLSALCIVISALSLYGILQYSGIVGHTGGIAVSGSYDNPAGFAATLSSALPFVMLGCVHRSCHLRILHLLTLVLAFVALGLSESRAGIVSAVAVFILERHRLLTRHSYVKWILVALCVAAIIPLAFEKADSASGRLLIWICSLRMIKERWLFGYGPGGFESHYMDFQASYLKQNPDSPYAMLADTVQYPFSEYLHVLSDYGAVGLTLVLLYIGYMLYRYMKNKTQERWAAFLSIVSVSVFSMFSYPLIYPFVWFILLYGSAVLLSDADLSWRPVRWARAAVASVAVLISCYGAYRLYVWSEAQIRWKKVAVNGVYDSVALSEYEDLYKILSDDRYFVYNYSYALYMSGDYDAAGAAIDECRKLWADYDVEMLSGMIAENRALYPDAESHYIHAAEMCPNRFRPLYRLMKLYGKAGDDKSMRECAEKILTKNVKIPSPEVEHIRQDARMYIDKSDT